MSFAIAEPPVVAEVQAIHAAADASASSETLAAAATGSAGSDSKLATSPEVKRASLPPRADTLALSRTPTLVAPAPAVALPSTFRRYTLLAVFSLAQFFDVYLSSATIIGIATISQDLAMTPAEASWLINAYTLTLAAFLLAAGRISDMFSAKWTFVCGFAWVGLFCLGIGFSRDKTTIIVLRAFSGIGASATIPAALNLIVHLFPNDKERARAISIFGGTGAIANVLGLVLGAVMILAGWQWIFYLVTIITLPGALLAAFLIPAPSQLEHAAAAADVEEKATSASHVAPAHVRPPKMDYLGLLLLTAAIVLLIFGLSDGNVEGFDRAQSIAPLVLGVVLFPAFFFWETRIDPLDALINPATWNVKNFTLLTVLSLVPYFWWFLPQTILAELFQKEWHTSAIMTSAYLLPNGIAGGAVIVLNGYLPKAFTLKQRIIVGSAGATIGALLLAFASEKHWYWPLIFPGLIVGSASMALVYVSSNVALILSVPAEHSGVAGGVFNSSLQLGTSIGLSIATAIQVSYPSATSTPEAITPSWKGYQSSLFFSVACTAVVIVLTLLFFRDPLAAPIEGSAGEELVEAAAADESPDAAPSAAVVAKA